MKLPHGVICPPKLVKIGKPKVGMMTHLLVVLVPDCQCGQTGLEYLQQEAAADRIMGGSISLNLHYLLGDLLIKCYRGGWIKTA